MPSRIPAVPCLYLPNSVLHFVAKAVKMTVFKVSIDVRLKPSFDQAIILQTKPKNECTEQHFQTKIT